MVITIPFHKVDHKNRENFITIKFFTPLFTLSIMSCVEGFVAVCSNPNAPANTDIAGTSFDRAPSFEMCSDAFSAAVPIPFEAIGN